MKALVTGAGGFVGKRLVQRLRTLGHQVVALHSPRAEFPSAHSIGRELSGRPSGFEAGLVEVSGDIADRHSLEPLFDGVGWIFHLAAAVSTRSLADSRRVNVDGTANIAALAASSQQRPTVVHVSSLAVAGARDQATQESDPCHPTSHYGRTKWEAEALLREYAKQIPITIVRPPCVFGGGDPNLLSLYQTVQKGWNLMLDARSEYSFVHVDDLIEGLLASAQQGRRLTPAPNAHDGIYFVCDSQPVTFVQLANMIGDSLGVKKVRHVTVPSLVGWSIAAFGETFAKITGRKVYLNFDKIREATAGSWVCNDSKARAELEFTNPMTLRERVEQTTDDYRKSGWIKTRC